MSHSSDSKRDELRNRLADQALREVFSGEAPPDLSDEILAAADKQIFVSPQRKEQVMDKSKRSYGMWVTFAVTACVVVGIGIALMLPAVQVATEQPAQEAALQEVRIGSAYAGVRLIDDSQSLVRGRSNLKDWLPGDSEAGELWGDSREGQGPGRGGDKYDLLLENPFRTVTK